MGIFVDPNKNGVTILFEATLGVLIFMPISVYRYIVKINLRQMIVIINVQASKEYAL